MNFYNPFRCLSNKECKGYQYQETKEATCMLILRSCGAADSQIFQQNDISQIYEKGLLVEGQLSKCCTLAKFDQIQI